MFLNRCECVCICKCVCTYMSLYGLHASKRICVLIHVSMCAFACVSTHVRITYELQVCACANNVRLCRCAHVRIAYDFAGVCMYAHVS